MERKPKAIVAGLLAAALAIAGFGVTACKDNPGPTALGPPYTPPVITSARYTVLVTPSNPEASYPLAGELFLDGRSIWAGAMGEPQGEFSYYYNLIPFNINLDVPGALPAGTHTLALRITDQRRSPTQYLLSGRVDVTWSVGFVNRVASWTDVAARLRTGDDWATEFVVPELPYP